MADQTVQAGALVVVDREEDPRDTLLRRFQAVVADLEKEAMSRVGLRQAIEARWLEDLRQYHGRYDPETETNLRNKKNRSKVFINRTRRKTRAMGAKLKDMLFPADDRNWGIEPTPVPDLTAEADAAVEAAREAKRKAKEAAEAEEAGEAPEGTAVAAKAEADEVQKAADALNATRDEAKRRARAMELEMADQLAECRYEAAARDAIDDACKLGTGITKGPVLGLKRRRGWAQVEKKDENGAPVLGRDGQPLKVYELGFSEGERPEYRRVDPWCWFPDPNAASVEESEGFFERHLCNKKAMRRLARDPSFSQDAIRRVLQTSPQHAAPNYLQELRAITGEQQVSARDSYVVWEYTGPLEPERMRTLALQMQDEYLTEIMQDVDELSEIAAVVWFCQGEVLKLDIYPLDSDEPLYSAFCIERDEGTIWGKGIPAIARDGQRAMNASWRAMLDNGGFAAGPHIFLDDESIEPMDGDWENMVGPKLWRVKKPMTRDSLLMQQFQVAMNQEQLGAIIALAEKFIDDETGLPALMEGEQQENTKTVGGMALLMSAGLLLFKDAVKNFDDDMTVPNIRRLYDWNMQHSEKEHIKGDYQVRARGVGVLLVREMQAQNLMWLLATFGPEDPDLKAPEIKRELLRAMSLAADDYLRTPDEREEFLKQMQQGPSEGEIKMAEIEAQREATSARIAEAEMETSTRLQVARTNYDAQMFALAEKLNMDVEKLRAMLADKQQERASKERLVATEAAVAMRTGEHAGGSV